MTDKADHIVRATEAVSAFQRRRHTSEEHVITDLICDLGIWPMNVASTSSARSHEGLDTGMRSIMRMLAAIFVRTP
jgi:hypothetical protein